MRKKSEISNDIISSHVDVKAAIKARNVVCELAKTFVKLECSTSNNAVTEVEREKRKHSIETKIRNVQAEKKFEAFQHCNYLAELTKSQAITYELQEELHPQNLTETMLMGQMAALHHMGMTLLGSIKEDWESGMTSEQLNLMTNSVTKLFAAYRNSMQTLHQCRQGGQQTITVKHLQINGGQNVIADNISAQKGGGDEKN